MWYNIFLVLGILLGYAITIVFANAFIRCAQLLDPYMYGYDSEVILASIFWPLFFVFLIVKSIVLNINNAGKVLAARICPNKQ